MSELTEAIQQMIADQQRTDAARKAWRETLDEATHQLCAYSLRLDKHTAMADAQLNAIYHLLTDRDLPRPE